ncbi:MAG: hypothetical protein A2539_09615 [Elusimicrobia bacterium RIFOXYD2_FULL_34_15]|nr:MAG: hypothetical protein A2539_09615 [Elusimicrobia bacterium RIFOXYD2_FULL_34_15]
MNRKTIMPIKRIFRKTNNLLFQTYCNIRTSFYNFYKVKNSFAGFTLVEMLLTIVILAIVVLSLTKIQYFMSTNSLRIKEKSFATQKTIQMMEELRSLVAGSEKSQISVLDDYDDGNQYYPVLTIDKSLTDPLTPSSNNVKIQDGWKYLRRINILKNPEDKYTRKVYIRVYKTSLSNPSVPSETLAETFGILKTLSAHYEPTQVYDLYILALENVPGWWSSMATMKFMFEGIVRDFQIRNPRLNIRTHWITRIGYGRDKQYKPYINSDKSTKDASNPMPSVYFYPGKTHDTWDSSGTEQYFYHPSLLAGKVTIDGLEKLNQNYPMCDMYNHAVRYPEEVDLYKKYNPSEISLRMFLEKINTEPIPFKNMIFVNLHGQLIPTPPMRNYSDAAKDPQSFPYVRVVTHPENLQSGSTAKLRVYSYVTNPGSYSGINPIPNISVYLPNSIPGSISVEYISGNSATAYQRNLATVGGSQGQYRINTPAPTTGTLITLYGSPVLHPINGSNQGLPPSQRLYGMEYIPCAVSTPNIAQPFNDFDLTKVGNNHAKNTARWIITLNNLSNTASIETPHYIQTRIGNDIYTDYPNLSETYAWVNHVPPATELYQFIGDPRHCPYLDVKINKGYNWFHTQVLTTATGYAYFEQTRNGWGGDKLEIDIPRFFQIYRDGLLNTNSIFSCMAGSSFYYYGLGGEFGSDKLPLPYGLPFIKQPWSDTAGQDSTRLYVDEIFPDRGSAFPFPDINPPTPNYPIIGNLRVIAKRDKSWYSKFWLGELYPDDQYASNWLVSGNIPTGSGNFFRVEHSSFSPLLGYGEAFTRTRKAARTSGNGCTSFFNGISASGGHFRHADMGSTPKLHSVGRYDANNSNTVTVPFNSSDPWEPFIYAAPLTVGGITLKEKLTAIFNLPIASSTVVAPRPITINCDNDTPTEWSNTVYSSIRTTLSIPEFSSNKRVFYGSDYNIPSEGGKIPTDVNKDHDKFKPYYASSVVKMNNAINSSYFVFSGFLPQGDTGAAEMGKYVLMTIIRTFLDGGQYLGNDKISQIPLVDITNPSVIDEFNNPSTINVIWNADWQRWDSEPSNLKNYTEEYTSTYSESTELIYSIKYSSDNARTWYYCGENEKTTPGQKYSDNNPSHNTTSPFADKWYKPSPYVWDVSTFPKGSYIIRVECYRKSIDLHYSYDQIQIYLNR